MAKQANQANEVRIHNEQMKLFFRAVGILAKNMLQKKKLKWPDDCEREQNYIIMNSFLFGCRHENQMHGNGT